MWHDTSAGLELLGQNFADLVYPGWFNLCCRSLEDIVAKDNSKFVKTQDFFFFVKLLVQDNDEINLNLHIIVYFFPCEASELTQQVQEPYLHDKNFISWIAPNFKFLIVSFSILCDAHRAHL